MKWINRLVHKNKKILTIELFYSLIDNQESLFPTLNPHPGLEKFKISLEDIREYPLMTNVFIVIDSWHRGRPVSNHIVTVGQRVSPEETDEFASNLGLLSYIDNEDKYKVNPKKGESIGIIYANST